MTAPTTPGASVELDTFTLAYIECALWSSHDNADDSGGEPLSENYSREDIAPDALAQMIQDCREFRKMLLVTLPETQLYDVRAGHDFWLNRNGHGSGFGDEYNGPDQVRRLALMKCSEVSKSFGSFDLYIGDDGLIYA